MAQLRERRSAAGVSAATVWYLPLRFADGTALHRIGLHLLIGVGKHLGAQLLLAHHAVDARHQEAQQFCLTLRQLQRQCLVVERATGRVAVERTTAQLLSLAAQSRATLDLWRTQEALDIDFSSSGKLVMFRSPAAFEGARQQLALQQRLGGAPQEAVSSDEACAIEPALAPRRDDFAGGIYTDSECAADCLAVCQGLQRLLAARGVRFVLGTRVEGFVHHARRIAAVQTSAGAIEAQQFVLALGSASHQAAKTLGFRLPIYPLKGYSVTLDTTDAAGAAPRVNVTDAARKVVFARIGRRLRVAGMAELVGHDDHIPPARIQSLCEATRALFPGCSDFSELSPWTGMRPATPTGVPLVGRHTHAPDNLLLNTGHGALGFTLAFGTAAQVAELVVPTA